MHFMQVLNSLMDKDTECRERRLNCKTYVSIYGNYLVMIIFAGLHCSVLCLLEKIVV
jgi:hypothetical protein